MARSGMDIGLEHLPEDKRQELGWVLEVLFRAFEAATKARTSERRQGRILKVVLFGSYARGDWVDDPVGGYKSDYDLLIVVDNDELTDTAEYWADAETQLQQAFEITHLLSAPAQFIVHSLSDVNRQLSRGRPFFIDIVREGLVLYDTGGSEFSRPRALSREEAHREALENFEAWFPSAQRFLQYGADGVERGWPNEAAFQLHQSAERFYHCVLLTQTLYSTKSHNLNFLRAQAERVAPEVIPVWPRGSRFEKRTWELLRRAYVEARFSKHYAITTDELTWLMERLRDLQGRVEKSCQAYLATLAPGDS